MKKMIDESIQKGKEKCPFDEVDEGNKRRTGIKEGND